MMSSSTYKSWDEMAKNIAPDANIRFLDDPEFYSGIRWIKRVVYKSDKPYWEESFHGKFNTYVKRIPYETDQGFQDCVMLRFLYQTAGAPFDTFFCDRFGNLWAMPDTLLTRHDADRERMAINSFVVVRLKPETVQIAWYKNEKRQGTVTAVAGWDFRFYTAKTKLVNFHNPISETIKYLQVYHTDKCEVIGHIDRDD